MKCRNKWILFILCCVIFLNTCYWAYASQNDSVSRDTEEYSITVTSNEYGGDVNVILYKIEEKYYLSLEDIKSFTRFQMAEDENSIVLTQGIREITIEKNSGYMVDCGFVDQGNIELVEYNGNWLCEAVPMLKYMGASCAINEKGNFEVMMPTATIWEAIMQNYWGYYFNVFQAYGKRNMIISLACDITADLFDGINGHGIFLTSDTYFKDALYEILDVDTMEYKSAQILAGKENENINEFLSAEIKEDLSEILHGGRDPGVDVLKDTINYYIDSYFDSGIIRDEFAWQNLYKDGDFNSSALWSKKINEKICKKFSVKGKVNLAYDILDIGLLAFDTAKTVDNLLQYDEDTRKLFERTITDEILQYTGYDKISWKNLSDKITKDLSSKGSIFRSASIDNIVDYIEGQVTDGGLKTLIAQFTSAAGTYQLGIKLGSFIAGLINYELNKAYAADIKAICLCSIQYDIGQLLSRMMAKEYDEYRFSDRDSLEKLKAMFTLYYRTAIAFSKNMAVSIQEFGGKNKKEWVDYFSGESGITNSAAEYLYKITNCEIVPIAKYCDLKDTELTKEKIEKLKMKNISQESEKVDIEAEEDAYKIYRNAAENSISSGNWREEVQLTGDMNLVSSDQKEKVKTKATLEAACNVENYDEKNLSKLKISGDGKIQVAGQSLTWTVDYSDGVAHYQYTEPTSYTNDVAIDPVCFQFNVLTREMMQDASVTGDTISFTLSGDEMAQVTSDAMNMMSGIENLEFDNGTVEILINKEEEIISDINMTFHAFMEYMGYQADVDYDVKYQFIPSDGSKSSETEQVSAGKNGAWYGQFDESKVPEGAGKYNGHYYYAYNLDSITNWEDAKQYCEQMGGYLATVTSRGEDEFLYSYLKNECHYENAYLGFTDREEEGNWKWSNGEESSYTNWHEGEPNAENPEEDFVMYYYKYSDGSWNDGDFDAGTVNGGTVFICEWGEYQTGSNVVEGSAEELYSSIITEYHQAFSDNVDYSYEELKGKYPYVNQSLVSLYFEGSKPFYGFYDVDGNGVDELFIGYETIEGYEYKIVDILTYKTESGQIRNIGDGEVFSVNAGSFVYDTGVIYNIKADNIARFYRISSDGYHLELIKSYTLVKNQDNRFYFNDTEMLDGEEFDKMLREQGNQVPFEWSPLDEI